MSLSHCLQQAYFSISKFSTIECLIIYTRDAVLNIEHMCYRQGSRYTQCVPLKELWYRGNQCGTNQLIVLVSGLSSIYF